MYIFCEVDNEIFNNAGANSRGKIASRFYEALFGNGNSNKEDNELEIDNNEDIITKSESQTRIMLLLHTLAIFLLTLETCLFILLFVCQTNSIIQIGNGKPHIEKKLLLYKYETVIEYNFGQEISKGTLPIKVFDNSYGYIVHGKDMRLLNLIRKFTNNRSNFKDGNIILSNSKPPLLIENLDYEA